MMDVLMVLVAVLVGGVLLLLMFLWGRATMRWSVESYRTAFKASQETISLQDQVIQQQKRELTNLEQQRDHQARRAAEYFGVIDGVCKERDQWQQIYRISSIQSGNAQAWLLRTLDQAIRYGQHVAAELRSTGRPVPDLEDEPGLRAAIEAFAEQHPGQAGIVRAPGKEALDPSLLPPTVPNNSRPVC